MSQDGRFESQNKSHRNIETFSAEGEIEQFGRNEWKSI